MIAIWIALVVANIVIPWTLCFQLNRDYRWMARYAKYLREERDRLDAELDAERGIVR
jgi:hypothetical protein